MAWYLEARPARSTTSYGLAADLARHLHSRQHLGSAVIVSDAPLKLLTVVRKQWFKLARNLQRERASTVNAQKILHLTYAVTRMHALAFVAKTPEQRPDADIFFIHPSQIREAPPDCYSLYLATKIEADSLREYVGQLPAGSLVVDYAATVGELAQEASAKTALSEQVRAQWRRVLSFLQKLHIDIDVLAQEASIRPSLLDDVLDSLLDYSTDFLRVAGTFQHALQLAQPLEPPHESQRAYNTVMLLAHRVQALTTGRVSDYLDSMASDNSFFLRDTGGEQNSRRKQLTLLCAYHQRAGHQRVIEKLRAISGSLSTQSNGYLLSSTTP